MAERTAELGLLYVGNDARVDAIAKTINQQRPDVTACSPIDSLDEILQ